MTETRVIQGKCYGFSCLGYVFIFIFILFSNVSFGQKFLVLTNHWTKEKVIILPHQRVVCKFNDGRKEAGKIENITDSSFTLNATIYSLESLSAISKRKKWSAAFIIVVLVGTPIITMSIFGEEKSVGNLVRDNIFPVIIEMSVLIKPMLDYRMLKIKKWDLTSLDFVPKTKKSSNL